MYEGALTYVKLGVGESVEFAVKVGVHEGSVLSPLLFEKLLEMIRQWKDGMEQKGLKVNMGKTLILTIDGRFYRTLHTWYCLCQCG
jgi:hypothetical protein